MYNKYVAIGLAETAGFTKLPQQSMHQVDMFLHWTSLLAACGVQRVCHHATSLAPRERTEGIAKNSLADI